jgi:phytoene synthase
LAEKLDQRVLDAYRECERITGEQARNFAWGIRLLPAGKRRALSAVYAFARRIDDIGDGELPPARKLELLDEAAEQLAELERSRSAAAAPQDPVLVALADADRRFALPPGALGELIEGVRMDVREVRYERFEELELYCRRVAGTIGRVCLAIFAKRGDTPDRAQMEVLADDLGVALQLTNILRDVREDAENGRVYLPAEDLRRFAVPVEDEMAASARLLLARASEDGDSLTPLIRFQAERAQTWFERGLPLVALLDRRSAACVSAMAGIYHGVLERIEADPVRALRTRTSLTGKEKALVALRSFAGLGVTGARSGAA